MDKENVKTLLCSAFIIINKKLDHTIFFGIYFFVKMFLKTRIKKFYFVIEYMCCEEKKLFVLYKQYWEEPVLCHLLMVQIHLQLLVRAITL